MVMPMATLIPVDCCLVGLVLYFSMEELNYPMQLVCALLDFSFPL